MKLTLNADDSVLTEQMGRPNGESAPSIRERRHSRLPIREGRIQCDTLLIFEVLSRSYETTAREGVQTRVVPLGPYGSLTATRIGQWLAMMLARIARESPRTLPMGIDCSCSARPLIVASREFPHESYEVADVGGSDEA